MNKTRKAPPQPLCSLLCTSISELNRNELPYSQQNALIEHIKTCEFCKKQQKIDFDLERYIFDAKKSIENKSLPSKEKEKILFDKIMQEIESIKIEESSDPEIHHTTF